MKYCEKCGNELKEGFAFCDKCGAKVGAKEEKKEKKEHEEKEEVKEHKVEARPAPVMVSRPQKSGKGQIIFLWILNILLLAATITFLILWLTKPTKTENYSNSNGGGKPVEPTPTPTPSKKINQYVGKWEQNVEYKQGSKIVQRTYGMIELKNDGTFESIFYDKDDKTNTLEEVEGTYEVDDDTIYFSYKVEGVRDTLELEIKNGKMCLNDDCDDYLVKDGNNKITIVEDDDDDDDTTNIKSITYTEYQNLQKEYKDAIVVIIKDGCSWCEKFESVVEDIAEEYATPVYYYTYDGKVSVSGTPTTIIIKNGYIVDSVEGYKEFSDMADILDDLGVK